MENQNLTPKQAEIVRIMTYLEKHNRSAYHAALCSLAYLHEKQDNQFDNLTEILQKLTRGDFKRAIKHLRKVNSESIIPGVVDYIRCRWLGKEATV